MTPDLSDETDANLVILKYIFTDLNDLRIAMTFDVDSIAPNLIIESDVSLKLVINQNLISSEEHQGALKSAEQFYRVHIKNEISLIKNCFIMYACRMQ
jgi:hypothetical protein